jgi:hypothetical protein
MFYRGHECRMMNSRDSLQVLQVPSYLLVSWEEEVRAGVNAIMLRFI